MNNPDSILRMTDWVIPQNLKLSMIEYIINHKNRNNYKKISSILSENFKFRNKHKDQRCFILATGPSINKQNLKPLRNELCIALSNFFVHPDFQYITPKYYCVAPYHLPIKEESYIAWIKEIDYSIQNETSLFFCANDYWRIKCAELQKNKYFIPFFRVDPNRISDSFYPDLMKKVINPSTVVIMGIQVAMYMGFKEIYLLGCDHDYILHYGESRHFYQENEHVLVREGCSEWENYSLYNQMQGYILMWDQYLLLKRISEKRGIRIFNATFGGMLDIFERSNIIDELSK